MKPVEERDYGGMNEEERPAGTLAIHGMPEVPEEDPESGIDEIDL